MQEQECTLDVKTIEAAVAGEQWALGKVLEYYADYMEELATVEIGQPDGSVKKIVDEDLKQQIGLKLLEEISMFTHSSFSKKRPGQNSLSIEMSGAFSTGLVSTWSIINITLVTYYLYPLTDIVIIGTIAIAFCYILFVVIAYIRNSKNNKS